MQRTKIEWADYSWNPVKGLCPQACWYCYARAMYKRFKWNPKLRLDSNELYCRRFPQHGGRIFVGSTIDLFHPKIPTEWIANIIRIIENSPWATRSTFIFLTKNPARYAEFDFPKNCWLGVTVTNQEDCKQVEGVNGIVNLKVGENKLFVSCEPLLGNLETRAYHWDLLHWIIAGAMTGAKAKQHQPDKKWVERIVSHCKYSRFRDNQIPVFLKNNLAPIWGDKLIQEFPE